MDVNRPFRIAVSGLLLAALAAPCCAQAGRSSYDPLAQQRSSKQKDGFVDFTLKRINPCDTDYGKQLDDGRKLFLEETMENGYFWSNMAALGLLGCLFVIIVYQNRVHSRREWTAAETLAELEHAMALANAQLEEATKRNRGLMEAMAALRDSTLRSHSTSSGPSESTTPTPTLRRAPVVSTVVTVAAKNESVKPANNPSSVVATATEPAGQIGLFMPEVDLITKVNSLQQQLGRSEEREKQLRRQLNESVRKLQTEREQNRSLKGE